MNDASKSDPLLSQVLAEKYPMGARISLGLQHGLVAIALGAMYTVPTQLALKIAVTAAAALWLYCRCEDSYREAARADDDRRFLFVLALAVARSLSAESQWGERREFIRELVAESHQNAQLQLILQGGLRPTQLQFLLGLLCTVAGALAVAGIAWAM